MRSLNKAGPALDNYIWTSQSWLRIEMLRRTVLALFSADLFSTHIGSAWRYGAANFGLAHFAWLDALPAPNAAAYLSVLSVASGAALFAAWTPKHRVPTVIACALYTYMWSSSMLDSYQHHYLLSWVLLVLATFPEMTSETNSNAETPSWTALSLLLGIVYAYSAVTKTEEAWQNGDAVRSITHNGQTIPAALAWSQRLGIESPFRWMGRLALVSEIVASAVYFLLPSLRSSKLAHVLRWIGFFAATGFHIFAEYLDLSIGWFSYYMLAFACGMLFPVFASENRLARRVAMQRNTRLPVLDANTDFLGHARWVLPIFVCAVSVYLGRDTGLPGLGVGFLLAALSVYVSDIWNVRGAPTLRSSIAILCFWIVAVASLATTDERFDFFRFRAGDEARRGEIDAAIEDYIATERYAPREQKGRRLDDIARLRNQRTR